MKIHWKAVQTISDEIVSKQTNYMIISAERPDEKLTRKMQIVRMGIRVIQGASSPPPSRNLTHQASAEASSKPSPETRPDDSEPPRKKSIEDANKIKEKEGNISGEFSQKKYS